MIIGYDGKKRCFGGEEGKELYAQYHDQEWGIPQHEDRYLFEMLILEGAQAGLSWETILKKRKGYLSSFHNFDPEKVANMKDTELEKLRENPAIVRNRLKIYGTRKNAQAFLCIQDKHRSFDAYLWNFVDKKPILNCWSCFKEVPVKSSLSDKISKDLKEKGMVFVGPTIIYAYLQAVGIINDHLRGCWRYRK